MNINLLKEIIAKVGGDVENLPDNLLTTHLKALCEALGVDTSNVKDNLITTLLKAMHGSDVPDDLLTTHLKALCETLGIDTSDIADNLTSSYLQKILDGEISGGGSGGSTYADQLYEFYGVDKAIYPYVTVEYFSYSPKWAVYFLTRRDSDLWFYGGLYGKYEKSGFSDMGNIAGMIEFVESHIPTVKLSEGNYSFVNQERNPNYTLYTNFDLTVTQATLYRLDE